MKFFPTKFVKVTLPVFVLLLIFSCGKDTDFLVDSVLNDPYASIEEREKKASASTDDQDSSENDTNSETDSGLISKTATFYSMNDAYIDNNVGHDKSFMRLQQDSRTGYLMFDLSEINEINGIITDVSLEFNVELDAGSGSIEVHKGLSNSWSEDNLDMSTAPQTDILLGQINENYELGANKNIALSALDVEASKLSLIMSHIGSNDLAFASKEHPAQIGPRLVVTYEVAAGTPDIVNTPPEIEADLTSDNITNNGGQNISDEILFWKEQFDENWLEEYPLALSLASSRNLNQEYYYLGYFIDGLTSMWQATGDNTYLDTALSLIDLTVNDANIVGNGFKGWIAADGVQYALWDSFYWRHVTHLLRIMNDSPSLLNSGYSSKFQELLQFSEKNIWERYEESGLGNMYRSRTHMASHWARIGMDLYLITGKSKYKEVFDAISHGKMEGQNSNLRQQLYMNPNNPDAYAWDDQWGVSKGSRIQDTSHAGAIISFMVSAYENGMYWNYDDIQKLIPIVEIVWPTGSEKIRMNIDGSGGTAPDGRLNEWLYLGRFSQKIQNRIKRDYTGRHLNFYGTQSLGIAALNDKILADGKGVYPEN